MAVLAGKEARLFVGELAVSTNTSPTLASLAFAVLPSQMSPAQWRDVWLFFVASNILAE